MITLEGQRWVRMFLANEVETLGESVAFGIGSTAPTTTDRDLEYEVMRSPISFRSYDPLTGEVVLRTPVPTDMAARLTEVGLWANANDNDGTAESQQLLVFDDSLEAWTTPGTFVDSSRIGNRSLQITANGTSEVDTDGLSLSQFGNGDRFALAIGGSFTGSTTLGVRFLTDSSNYYSYSISVTAGSTVRRFEKADASITGNPTWDAINKIQFITSSSSSLNMRLEGLRVINADNAAANYVLIARQVVAPLVVDPARTSEMELRIGVSVS